MAQPQAASTPQDGWMLSADSHIMEPPEIWERLDREFRERAPRIQSFGDEDWYVIDGVKWMAMSPAALVGKKNDGVEALKATGRWSDVPRGAYEAGPWLEANEVDGVWGGVIYPTLGFLLFGIPESRFFSALARAYNDYMADFSRAYPGRIKTVAIINLDDIDEAVAEIRRVKKLGLVCGLIACDPGAAGGYDEPRYEPVWRVCEELAFPLAMHTGSWRQPRTTHVDRRQWAIAAPNKDFVVRRCLSQLMFSGVFERFPKLLIGPVEYDASWVPYWLKGMDDTYSRMYLGNYVYRYRNYAKPSEVWRARSFVTFSEDPYAIPQREVIGTDIMMWHNDYPHSESSWPNSREIVNRLLAGVSAEERHKLLVGNVARMFGLELPPALARAGTAAAVAAVGSPGTELEFAL